MLNEANFSPQDFASYYTNSYLNLEHEGVRQPAKCLGSSGGGGFVVKIIKSLNTALFLDQAVPLEKLLKWDVLSWPKLGYVQMSPNLVMEVCRNQAKTQYKALHPTTVSASIVGKTYDLLGERLGWETIAAKRIFADEYGIDLLCPNTERCIVGLWHDKLTPFDQALHEILEAKYLARAVTRDFALVLNHDSDCTEFPVTLMFQGMELAKFRRDRSYTMLQDATLAELRQLYNV